jgi:hypothetical protein
MTYTYRDEERKRGLQLCSLKQGKQKGREEGKVDMQCRNDT